MLRCRIDWRRWVHVAALLVALALGDACWPATLPATTSWGEVIEAYLRDPAANGEALIDLAGARRTDLPPVVRLAVADALLRRGDSAAVRRLLPALADAAPASPWSSFAQLGLGMVEARRGNLRAAWARFAAAARTPGAVGRAALLAGAHAAAALGDAATAGAFLDRLLHDDPGLPAGVRWAGELARATIMLGEQDPLAAARAFSALRQNASDSEQAADASYGEAQASLRQGDVEAARLRLRALLAECATGPSRQGDPERHASSALLRLESRAILRTWLLNYRTTSFAGADSGAVYALHGCDLAVEQMAALDPAPAPASHASLAGSEGRLTSRVVAADRVKHEAPRTREQMTDDDARAFRTPGAPRRVPWSAIAALGIAMLLAGLAWREHRSG